MTSKSSSADCYVNAITVDPRKDGLEIENQGSLLVRRENESELRTEACEDVPETLQR